MNILFIGYWSVHDGLSEATIRPHLEALSKMENIKSITYVSIERSQAIGLYSWDLPKVEHIPFFTPSKRFFLDKFFDFTKFPIQLSHICKKKTIDKIICRSSPAGAIGYLVWRKTKIPYYVESFEPHAEYMAATGVWKRWDIRYMIQKYFEKKIKCTASGLMPVSLHYKKHLLDIEMLTCPVEIIPCAADLDKFKIDPYRRGSMRKALGFDKHAVVGIYVGKFGDIYFDDKAYRLFHKLKKELPEFKMIILSSDDRNILNKKMRAFGFSAEDLFIDKVPHHEVPDYLNASDLAFCLHVPHAYSFAYSPIKNGEYWACGLPIILSEGIGDDSRIVNESGLGMVSGNIENFDEGMVGELLKLLSRKPQDEIRQLAIKFRDPKISSKVYDTFLFKQG